MPNTLAYIVLFSWPLVTVFLFRRFNLAQALSATILLGYLFIPERVGFKLPGVPAFDKTVLPSLCAVVMIGLHLAAEKRAARRTKVTPEGGTAAPPSGRVRPRKAQSTLITRFLLLVIIGAMVAPLITYATNTDPIIIARTYIAPATLYDTAGMIRDTALMFLPLWLARGHLRTREAQIDVLKVLIYAGLVYSVLVLWEARMSPRINIMLYGFFAHDWIQHIRGGAFRPIVFLEHGLRVGIFLAIVTCALAICARSNIDQKRGRWLGLTVYMLVVLFLSRNLGALMITVVIVPVILFMPARLQFLAAAMIALITLLYPFARGSGLIPADRIVSFSASIDESRASSLEYRLRNEDELLNKANQKPLAGWGRGGRFQVYNEETGGTSSVPDGVWVIVIGVFGWLGYLTQFGLLCLPVILLWWWSKRFKFTMLDAGIALMVCANLIDLIPNSSMVAPIWLMAGVLWGRLDLGYQTQGAMSDVPSGSRQDSRTTQRIRSHSDRQRSPTRGPNLSEGSV